MALPSEIYGSRVGQIPLPSPFGDLSAVIPNLPALNTAASSSIMNKLKGVLSPETLNMLHNYEASVATRSGMPGTNVEPDSLAYRRTLRDLGRTVEDTQSEGLRQLLPFLQTTSATQTVNPALQYERNLQNAINVASPEPAAAGTYAEQLFQKYMDMVTGPAGGTRRQVGMPQASFGPKPVAGPRAPSTPQRSFSGASSFTTDWTGRPSGPNIAGPSYTDLWDDPRFGPWGFEGAPQYVSPTSTGTFYAGEADPETGLPLSPWTPPGQPDYSTGEGVPELDPWDYFGLGVF